MEAERTTDFRAMENNRIAEQSGPGEKTPGRCPLGGSLLGQSGVLASATALAAVPILCVAFALEGTVGLWFAVAAGAACLAGGLLGLVTIRAAMALHARKRPATELAGNGQTVPGAVMLAMLGRMGVPLVLLVVAGVWVGPLRDTGVPYYLLGFYLVGLAAETWLLLPAGRRRVACAQNGQGAH